MATTAATCRSYFRCPADPYSCARLYTPSAPRAANEDPEQYDRWFEEQRRARVNAQAAQDNRRPPQDDDDGRRPPPRQQQFRPNHGAVSDHAGPTPMFLGGVRAFQISRKNTQALQVFSGDMSKHTAWRSRLVDHLVECYWRCEQVLEVTMECSHPITREYLESVHLGFGESAWPIAVDLEAMLVRFFSESMYERRENLAGRSREKGNGLEMWRNLGIRFAGTGKQAVFTTGLQTFIRFPKCEDENDLLDLALEWEEYLNQYATHLKANDATLRTLCLGIMPRAMEEKVSLKGNTYPNWQELIQYIKTKHEMKKQLLIAGALHKNKGSARKSGVHALTEAPVVPKAPPAPLQTNPSVQDLVNMVAALAAKGSAVARPPRRTDCRDGKKSKFGDKGRKEKCMWKSGKC